MHLSRRRFIAALGAFTLFPTLPGCLPHKPVRVASHVWPGYEFMFLAKREKWISEKDVSFLETASASESLAALRTGKADGAALTLDEVLRARGEGIPLTIVLVFDVSAGADVVMARPDIKTIGELKGKRIGLEESALGALILQKLLEKAALRPNDVTIINITPDTHVTNWKSNRVDAVITYDPAATIIAKDRGIRLFDSRQLPATILDVLAIKSDVINENKSAVRNLVAGHFRALNHFILNRGDATHRMVPRMKISQEEILDSFRGLELPDIATNNLYLSETAKGLDILSTAKNLSTIMTGAGLLKKEDTLKGLVTKDFLPKA